MFEYFTIKYIPYSGDVFLFKNEKKKCHVFRNAKAKWHLCHLFQNYFAVIIDEVHLWKSLI